MKKNTRILILALILLSLTLTSSVLADKSYLIHTPSGHAVNLVITKLTLNNIRIYNLDFANNGDTFSLTAALLRPSDGSHTLLISFYEEGNLAQSDYLDVGVEKATQEVYCPESFDRIVVDYFG